MKALSFTVLKLCGKLKFATDRQADTQKCGLHFDHSIKDSSFNPGHEKTEAEGINVNNIMT